MPKIFDQLISAQAENKASDYSQGVTGRFWINTGSSLLKFDDGAAIRVIYHTGNTVAIANGGTNLTTYTAGDLPYSSASNVLAKLGIGTTGQALKVAAGLPAWGTLAEVGGGTNQTTYTQGDLLYASGSNTLAKLGIGSSGTVLKSTGSIPAWQSGAQSASFTSKTHANTGYTILSSDDTIFWTLTNGSNDTATLPAASSNAGKVYTIRLALMTAGLNTLTVSRAGSDTITLADGSTGSTSLIFYTGGETYEIQSDGVSVWQVLNHRCNTDWASSLTFAPDATAFGTVAGSSFFWQRVGDTIEVSYFFEAGTVTANPAFITLPTNVAIDTNKIQGNSLAKLGQLEFSGTSAGSIGAAGLIGAIFFNSASASRVYLTDQANTDASGLTYVTRNANNMLNTGGQMSGLFRIPVSGWKS